MPILKFSGTRRCSVAEGADSAAHDRVLARQRQKVEDGFGSTLGRGQRSGPGPRSAWLMNKDRPQPESCRGTRTHRWPCNATHDAAPQGWITRPPRLCRRSAPWSVARIATICLMLFLPCAASPAPSVAQITLDPQIARFLQHPLSAMKKEKVPGGFRIIVLSNVAEYCVNLRLTASVPKEMTDRCLEVLVRSALGRGISPYRRGIESTDLGEHGLYLSHLNVILGAHRRGTQSQRFVAINRRISKHQRARSLAAPHRHVRSYASAKQRWPADQSVALYSIYLYDKNYQAHLSEQPIAFWLDYMKRRGTNATWGLPVSEVTGAGPTSMLPRGSALSFSVRYMAAFAPQQARALWRQYKKHFLVDMRFAAGFREWPPGTDRGGDIDSGPIVAGIGAAATGLALGASRAVGDFETHDRLRRTAALVGNFGIGDGKLQRLRGSLLARAIELNGVTIRSWYSLP